MPLTLFASANAAWNLLNFRQGLLRAWLAAGHRVIAAAPAGAHAKALVALGCEFVPVPLDPRGTSPLADLRLLLTYRRALAATRANVFLGWTIKPNIYGSLAARSLGISAINNVTGIGIGFSRGPVQRVIELLYRRALARSSTVFFQNDDDRGLFERLGLVRPAQSALLPGSGVDLHSFAAAPLPDGAPRFLMVGRVLRSKGASEFAAAARLVRARHPQARFQLLGGTSDHPTDGIGAAERATWGDDLELLAPVADVRPLLAAATCVVLPSYSEGVPRSLLEAAAVGRPLIATDIAGCRRIVRPGVNGWLVPVGDAAALADACFAAIAQGSEALATLGSASRLVAEAEFDERLVIERYAAAIAAAVA